MRRFLFLVSCLLLSYIVCRAEPEVVTEEKIEAKGEVVVGVPRLIRSAPETEVFFKDLNVSYIIPKNDNHNRSFEAVEKAIKSESAVSLRVDQKSRRVLGLAEGKKSSPGTAELSIPAKNMEGGK
jgi:hypothetical protein